MHTPQNSVEEFIDSQSNMIYRLKDLVCSHWAPATKEVLPMTEVIKDMQNRFEFGMQKYGKPCKPFDGEDYLQHAYEEAMDLCVYLKTKMMERDVGAK